MKLDLRWALQDHWSSGIPTSGMLGISGGLEKSDLSLEIRPQYCLKENTALNFQLSFFLTETKQRLKLIFFRYRNL